jgi:single-stranded-DNA-specific exonuclease
VAAAKSAPFIFPARAPVKREQFLRIVRRTGESDGGTLPAGIHPVLARVYGARAVCHASELDYTLDSLHRFDALGGVESALEILYSALADQQRVLIVGDYDADGATASAVALRGLRMLGFENVDYLVPNRFKYGYGLTPEIVEVATGSSPDVLITVDNGIASVAGAAAAADRGLCVIITDHHLPGKVLPEAAAIVNPNLPGDAFPSKCLAGVGVVFYLLIALRARLRQLGSGRAEVNLGRLLDLVALGTVADVVPLDRNNRILVHQGLMRIRSGNASPGVPALLQVAGRDARTVTASDLAYAAAPRLNAAGRLDDMSLGIECLLCDDAGRAMEIATRLDALNKERRDIEGGMQREALAQLESLNIRSDSGTPFGVVLYDESWHPGVVGIVASRVKDRVHRPVIAFAPEDESRIKGSARSINGVHIRDTLDAVATANPGLVERFGGHAMAAGLSIERGALESFRRAFDEQVRSMLGGEAPDGVVYSDGPLEPEDIGLELARLLREGGPWGQGFPEPMFDGEFEVLDRRIVGERHLKLRLAVPGTSRHLDAIAFNTVDRDWPDDARRVNIAYRLDVNVYRGIERPQLVVEHLECC